MLEINVTESKSDYLTPGTHRLVFDVGLYLTFTKREEFDAEYSGYVMSPAENYVMCVGSDRDFSPISAEGMRQFGLGAFIVARLDALAGVYEPRSEEEIRAYAEKYLSVDGDTIDIERKLMRVEGGYTYYGHGLARLACNKLSEEVRDGVTVITMRFYADYSRTVESRTVEFHMEILDGEFRPVKTVVLNDSELESVYYST